MKVTLCPMMCELTVSFYHGVLCSGTVQSAGCLCFEPAFPNFMRITSEIIFELMNERPLKR